MRMTRLAMAMLATGASLAYAAAPTVAPTPAIPTYGQAVSVGVQNSQYPFYIPATNFVRNGNSITVDYTYTTDGWDVGTPASCSAGAASRSAGPVRRWSTSRSGCPG